LKWRKTFTGPKFDLEHFNGPKSKFIRDSLYEHPVFKAHSFKLNMYKANNINAEDTFDSNLM